MNKEQLRTLIINILLWIGTGIIFSCGMLIAFSQDGILFGFGTCLFLLGSIMILGLSFRFN